MANTVTSQVINNGQKRLVMKFTNFSDGTAETGVIKVDAQSPTNGVTVQGQTIVPGVHLKVGRVIYDVSGMDLRIQFDATVDADMLVLAGHGTMDFEDISRLSNPGPVALPESTGSIVFTTVGAVPGSSYSVILEMIKGVPRTVADSAVPVTDFNFVGPLPAPFTFTRASNGWYFDSTGILQVAANDTARVDYDPTGASLPGTLLEAASTNQVRNPRLEGATPGTPGTAPTNCAVLVTAGLASSIVAAGSESGIPQFDVRIFGTTTGVAAVNIRLETTTGIAALTGQIWTASAFFRLIAGGFGAPSAGPFLQINEYTSGGTFVAGGNVAIAPTGAGLATQRAIYTRTLSGGGTVGAMAPLFVINYPASTVVDFTIRIGLPQCEQLGYASSPIMPPAGSPAASTRAADNLTLALPYAGFPGAVGWTAVLEFVPLAFPSSALALGLCASTGAADTTYALVGGTGNVLVNKRVASVSVTSSTAATLVVGATAKIAIAQNTVDAHMSGNGGAVVVAANAGYPTMITLSIGRAPNSGTNYQPMRGRRLRLWPRKLSDAELQAVTA